MTTWTQNRAPGSGFVEVLASERTGRTFGYRLIGAGPGPTLLVAGLCPVAESVFDRLVAIPTLPWMRGSMILLRLDALPGGPDEAAALNEIGPVDRTLNLPWSGDAMPEDELSRKACTMILRTCMRLGMIAGRGVR